MANKILSPEELEDIKKDPAVRKALAKQSHRWFFSIYLAQYIKYPFAPFHYEIFNLTEDKTLPLVIIVAFRGSAKSTLISLSYPIWAITGKEQKKFVLILTQTEVQAKLILANIKKELESNELLKKDIGPFQDGEGQWAATSIVLSNYNARITVASTEQSIRGIRHGASRPDLIICDDLEDSQSVKVKENRDKTYSWLIGDVFPAGDRNTKTVVIGNLLHEDSTIKRLGAGIEEKKLEGIYKEYPLLDKETGETLWPGKYLTQKAIDEEKQKIGNEQIWQREFLLNLIPDDFQVVHKEWIKYYDALPKKSYTENGYRFSAIAADLAISEKTTADYTAIITAQVYGYGDSLRIYILPTIINKRMDFPQTVATIKMLAGSLDGKETKIFIEEVGYQKALVDQLKQDGFLFAEGVPTHGQDKRARLTTTTDFLRTGKVLLPQDGSEKELVQQLTGFGIEKHDDLPDAFSILVLKIMEISSKEHGVSFGLVDTSATTPTLPDFSKLQEKPWKNEEELRKLEHEADLLAAKGGFQQTRNNWY